MAIFSSWNIRTKLLAGFGGALVVIVLFGLYLLGALAIARQSLLLLERRFDVLQLFSSLQADSESVLSTLQAFVTTGETSLEGAYDEHLARIDRNLVQLREVVADVESQRHLAQYEALVRELQGVELLIVARAAEGNTNRARELFETRYVQRQVEAVAVLGQAAAREHENVAATIHRNNRLLRSVQVTFWTAAAAGVAGVAVFLLLLTRHLGHSVQRLLDAAQAISGGDLRRRVAVHAHDELGKLAVHFNVMAGNLQRMMTAREQQSRQLLVQNYDLEQTKLRLEEAIAHLRQIDAAKSDFVSVAAHQLRTPLTGVKWTLHALAAGERAQLSPSQRKLVEDARQATDRLVVLVNDLLNVARLEEGRIGFSFQRQHLEPLLSEVVDRFTPLAQEKKVRLERRLSSEALPELVVDRERLAVVLDNLLDNSLKYTPPGGTVTLGARLGGGEVVVQVTDTGIGIPRGEQARVFSKFFRSENAQLSQTSGSGLGLFAARKIVEQHGGRMWFHSVENEGSTFAFALPLKPIS